MAFQNMMHQVSTRQVSKVLPQCKLVWEAGLLFQSIGASFSTLKWQFIKVPLWPERKNIPPKFHRLFSEARLYDYII